MYLLLFLPNKFKKMFFYILLPPLSKNPSGKEAFINNVGVKYFSAYIFNDENLPENYTIVTLTLHTPVLRNNFTKNHNFTLYLIIKYHPKIYLYTLLKKYDNTLIKSLLLYNKNIYNTWFISIDTVCPINNERRSYTYIYPLIRKSIEKNL